MADPAAEARIRDLKRRVELEPASRLFVALAEEYRKAGRHAEALSSLQKGLLAHPNYLSAQVALGRAYLEAGQITEAIATFSKVLANDPGNLVSAKWLADIYLSRGDSVEAIKKYKLYRALSGDRTVDDIIEQLEAELAPPPLAGSVSVSLPPPPTFFDEKPTGPIRKTREAKYDEPIRRAPPVDLDVTSVKFEPEDSRPRSGSAVSSFRASPVVEPPPVASAPVALAEPALPNARSPSAGSAEPRGPSALGAEPLAGPLRVEAQAPPESAGKPVSPEDSPAEPGGRVLADLYFAQGHFAEALSIYDDLVASNPHDEDLRRSRRDAEARLLPAAVATVSAASSDAALERRLGKVRILKRWLSVVQTG